MLLKNAVQEKNLKGCLKIAIFRDLETVRNPKIRNFQFEKMCQVSKSGGLRNSVFFKIWNIKNFYVEKIYEDIFGWLVLNNSKCWLTLTSVLLSSKPLILPLVKENLTRIDWLILITNYKIKQLHQTKNRETFWRKRELVLCPKHTMFCQK